MQMYQISNIIMFFQKYFGVNPMKRFNMIILYHLQVFQVNTITDIDVHFKT